VGGGIEAVNVGATSIVDEVLLGGTDEVAKLIVPGRVSGRGEDRAGKAHAMGILVG
jgi:hypothetical protein